MMAEETTHPQQVGSAFLGLLEHSKIDGQTNHQSVYASLVPYGGIQRSRCGLTKCSTSAPCHMPPWTTPGFALPGIADNDGAAA